MICLAADWWESESIMSQLQVLLVGRPVDWTLISPVTIETTPFSLPYRAIFAENLFVFSASIDISILLTAPNDLVANFISW